MKSQQLFEVDRQINQIRKNLQQRQQKAAQWNTPLSRILQPLPIKQRYLSKKYCNSHLTHYQHLQGRKSAQPLKMLQDHLAHSRSKVRAHHNELKELDLLVKKRNKIRLIKMQDEAQNKKATISQVPKTSSSPKKELSRTFYQHFQRSSKMEKKEREHPALPALKGDRILQIIQESKAMGLATDEVVGSLKKQLGIGIENTPFWSWVQGRRDEGVAQKCKTGEKWVKGGKENCLSLLKSLQKEVLPRRRIYYGKSSGFGQQFQGRLLHLIRYNQEQAEQLLE